MVEITAEDVEQMGEDASRTGEVATRLFGSREERQQRAVEGAIEASDDWDSRDDIVEDVHNNSEISSPGEVQYGATGESEEEFIAGGSQTAGVSTTSSDGNEQSQATTTSSGETPGTTNPGGSTQPPSVTAPADGDGTLSPMLAVAGAAAVGAIAWVIQ